MWNGNVVCRGCRVRFESSGATDTAKTSLDLSNLRVVKKSAFWKERRIGWKRFVVKIHALFKDGLKLLNIKVIDVNRKSSKMESKPGIVVVPFDNMETKRSVLKVKRTLKNSKI